MKTRKIIAKRNLKKSIYLGGGMAAFTAAVGLAVSIPVYNKIQEELSKTTSKLKDLSSMMSQLTNKLGIPEGASFQKELAGGYEVVYENGQTKIYKDNGEGKSLIINMNGDGTVGSAAQLQGPAAQAMLGVIQNAKASMEDDQAAMSDIIGPFADQAEDTSLATEAAITGVSVAALAQRNVLSAGEDKAAAAKRLDALIKRNAEIDQDKLDAANAKALELKAAAEQAKEDADKLAAAKRAGDAAKLQQVQDDQANAAVQPLKDFIATLDYMNPPAGPVSVTSDAPGPLSNTEIIDLADKNKGWALEAKLAAPAASDVDGSKTFLDGLRTFLQAKVDKADDNDGKNNLREYFQTQKISAVQTRLDQIKADAAKALAAAKLAATQRTTDHQMSKAADAGHVTPAIVKLAKSLPNAINALMSAKYGYMKEGVYKNPSGSVYKLIKQAMIGQGVSASTFDAIQNKIIQPLYDETATIDPVSNKKVQGTITFSEAVNTFALKETSVSRLLVLKASYVMGKTNANLGVEHDQLFLAKQTTKSPIDFESDGAVLQTIKSLNADGTPNSLYTAANYLVEAVNRDINPSITRDAAVALKDVVQKGATGALKGIKSPKEFYELVNIAKAIDPITKPIQEKALVEILLSLAKKYLFEGKDVKVDGQQIVDLVNNAFKYDGTKEPTLTLDATEQDVPIEYGPLVKKIIAEINKADFIDYAKFTAGSTGLVKFVADYSDQFDINEVEQLMNDPKIKDNLVNLKDLQGSEEGRNLLENNWDLAFATIDRTDISDVLSLINNQKYKSVTNDLDKMKDILAITGTPISKINTNLGKLFDSIQDIPTNKYLLEDKWKEMGLPLLQSTDFDGALKILNEDDFKTITSNPENVKELFATQGIDLTTVHDYLLKITTAMGAIWVDKNKQWVLDNVKNANIQVMINNTNKEYVMTNNDVRTKMLSETSISESLTKLDAIISSMTLQWVKDNQQWVLDNLDLDYLQTMINDVNNVYVMTNDDVRTKLLSEASIDDSLAKLDAIISSMTLQWVKDNQQWVLDNLDNDNLQKMILNTNKEKFMDSTDRRDLLLQLTNVDKALTNFDSIILSWGDKFITNDPKLEWFGQISKMSSFDEIIKLFSKTIDDKQILSSFDRIKELVSGAQEALAKDSSRTDIYDSVLKHIRQAEKVTGYDTFYGANEKILMSALLNTKDDITQALKDFTKYLTAPHVAGVPVIDLTDPKVMEQVTSASAVTAKLATQKLPAAQEEAVGNAMTSVIAAKALTQDEFKIVSTYTETVFKVFSDKVEAAKQLQKVLDPKVIKGEIHHIDTFNKWVAAIEKQHPGVTITKDMIEKYVWTKDITETPYIQAEGTEKMGDGYMIVSASYNSEDKGTYFVDHKLSTGRAVGKLVRDGTNTLVKKVEDNPEVKAKDGGSTPASSAYISGQTIHDGKIYWMGLNDNSGIAKYLYIYTIKTGAVDVVKLSRGSDDKIIGRIRTLTWANGKLYAAISNEQAPVGSPVKEFIEINPTTGKYIYLGQDSQISFFKDTSLGAYTYTSGAFVADGTTYLISPTATYNQHDGTWITITNRNTGRSSILDLDAAINAIGGNLDKKQAAVGTILGEFDPISRIQTIFVVNGDGAVIKFGVKIVGDGDATIGTRDSSLMSKTEGKTPADQTIQKGDPIIDRSKTMLLIDSGTPNAGTRGATFVDGAITVYGNTKAVYIADQTSNLNDIFKFLMEH